MGFVYYQPNPLKKGGIGDCSVRAVSKALNIPWDSAYIDLVTQGYFLKDMPSSNTVLNSYLHSKGFRRYAVSNLKPDCYSIRDFAKEHHKGIYIVGTGTHVCCVIGNSYFDSWDSGSECIEYYWRKEN